MRRRAVWYAMLLVSLLAGCKHPMRVVTENNVRVYGPSPQNLGPLMPMPFSGQAPATGRKIALVDVDGLLLNQDFSGMYSDGENPVAVFREKLDMIARDPCYSAVVLRINSPGGGVTASDMMRHDLRSFKARTGKPVIACLMDVGAGGAYYLATTADSIVAHPTTLTGGIGVILNLYNMADAMAQFNIVGVPVKSGENIDLGTPIHAQSDEGREILQQIAKEFHARFREGVIIDRPQLGGAPEDVFDGRVFTAPQAVKLQLVDSIGYLDDAAQMAGELGGAPGAPLVMLHRRHDRARSPYDATPNFPIQSTMLPLSVPGFERAKLPAFLYLWQPDPTLERTGGR